MAKVIREISARQIVEDQIHNLKEDRRYYSEIMESKGDSPHENAEYRRPLTVAIDSLESVYMQMTGHSTTATESVRVGAEQSRELNGFVLVP